MLAGRGGAGVLETDKGEMAAVSTTRTIRKGSLRTIEGRKIKKAAVAADSEGRFRLRRAN